MVKNRVTIVGLGCVGCSIGLALRQRVADVEVVGHDIEPERARRAARMEAVSKTHWNLPAACEGADMVILSLPLPAVRETMETIGPDLKEGCVVTDTAPLKRPVLEWAREYLPAHVRYATGVPLPGPSAPVSEPLAGPDAARADLFQDGVYCITPDRDSDPGAVETLQNLAHALGARLLFMSPVEYDGLQAGVVNLPALISVALLRATADTPGWRDMRQVAGPEFAALTSPAAPQGLWEAAYLNRENLIRRLDMFIAQVARLRQWLAEESEDELEAAYDGASQARQRWLTDRESRALGERPGMPEIPGAGERFSQMLFGDLFRRHPRGRSER